MLIKIKIPLFVSHSLLISCLRKLHLKNKDKPKDLSQEDTA